MPARARMLITIAWLSPVGILAQAYMAGRGLFIDADLFGLHGGIGHGVLAVAIVTAGVAWAAGLPRAVSILASLTVVALVVQTGLGYAGRRSAIGAASALHVPLGVTLLGLAVITAVLITQHVIQRGTRGSIGESPVSD